MSHVIPPDSPKAVVAAAFGRELTRAATSKKVSWNELERAVGLGRNSLIAYRRGIQLPRTEVAVVLAEVLAWPKLREMVLEARTHPCARVGCTQTFRNDTGAPRQYCSIACRELEERKRKIERAHRRGGQKEAIRRYSEAHRLMKSGLAIADEKVAHMQLAIAEFCNGCEPEGLCHDRECALRSFSPLPIALHEAGIARPEDVVRRDSYTPERRVRISAASKRRWDRPGEREKGREWMLEHGPAMREQAAEVLRATPTGTFSARSKKAWRTRRARAEEAAS